MTSLVLGAVFALLYVVSRGRDRRLLRNGVYLVGAVGFAGWGLLTLLAGVFPPVGILVVVAIALAPLAVLVLAVFAIANGVTVIRAEASRPRPRCRCSRASRCW